MAVSGMADCTGAYAGYINTAKKENSIKESGVKTDIVELKTATPGVTKTEQIKTGYQNVSDYTKYLQSKYSYMNAGTVSMQGILTTVSVSAAFLKKCMNDPEKARYLEENLAAFPDCVSYATSHALGTLTNISYEIDDEGNITGILSGTNDPDGKIARENAERKAKEEKAAKEKAAVRRKEKAAEEERAARWRKEKTAKAEKAAERQAGRKKQTDGPTAGGEPETFTVSVTGTNGKSVTENMIAVSSGISIPGGGSFDVKA